MLKQLTLCGVLVCLCAPRAMAQMTVEEAQQRMMERLKQRQNEGQPVVASPTTLPATLPSADAAFAAARQGLEALAAGQTADAIESLKEANKLYPNSTGKVDDNQMMICHGLAVAYMRQNNYAAAHPFMERALGAHHPSRPLTLNSVKLDIVQKSRIARALGTIDQWVRDHGDDEQALNLFGSGLSVACSNNVECKRFIADYEAAVSLAEAKRPGFRRWGTEWMSERDFRDKDSQRKALQDEIDRLQARIDADTVQRKGDSAQAKAYAINGALALNPYWPYNINSAIARGYNNRVNSLNASITRYQDEIAADWAKMPAISWDDHFKPLDPEIELQAQP